MFDSNAEYRIPSKRGISEVATYEKGVFTITADEQRLKLDFLEEAKRRQGIDLIKAETLANKLKVFFDRKSYDEHIKKEFGQHKNALWRASAPLIPVVNNVSEVLLHGGVVGSAFTHTENPAIYINPSGIGEYIPKNTSSTEVQEAGIIQLTNKTWVHERDHVLRMCFPENKSVNKRDIIGQVSTSVVLQNLVTAGYFGGLTALNDTTFLPQIPHIQTDPIPRMIISVVIGMPTGTALASQVWYKFLSRSEKSARHHEQHDVSLPNLFQFNFEKST